jgi:hypothetical protein
MFEESAKQDTSVMQVASSSRFIAWLNSLIAENM